MTNVSVINLFEYPEVLQFVDAINKSFWVHSEIDFTADVQDFHSNLQPYEQNAVKHALLAIAQIEVSVKLLGNLATTCQTRTQWFGCYFCRMRIPSQ